MDSNQILIIDPQLLDLTNLAKGSQRDQITITNGKLIENHPIIGRKKNARGGGRGRKDARSSTKGAHRHLKDHFE
jgi:hypothetical protein